MTAQPRVEARFDDEAVTTARPRVLGVSTVRSRTHGLYDGTRSVRLPHRTDSARSARHILVADLLERRIPERIVEEAESVVAELVANAARHARPLADGCVRVRWKVKGEAVEVEVRDGGSETTPRPARPSPWALSGRGLRIVRSMAHEWGVQEESNGRTVWAALGGPSRRRAG